MKVNLSVGLQKCIVAFSRDRRSRVFFCGFFCQIVKSGKPNVAPPNCENATDLDKSCDATAAQLDYFAWSGLTSVSSETSNLHSQKRVFRFRCLSFQFGFVQRKRFSWDYYIFTRVHFLNECGVVLKTVILPRALEAALLMAGRRDSISAIVQELKAAVSEAENGQITNVRKLEALISLEQLIQASERKETRAAAALIEEVRKEG